MCPNMARKAWQFSSMNVIFNLLEQYSTLIITTSNTGYSLYNLKISKIYSVCQYKLNELFTKSWETIAISHNSTI